MRKAPATRLPTRIGNFSVATEAGTTGIRLNYRGGGENWLNRCGSRRVHLKSFVGFSYPAVSPPEPTAYRDGFRADWESASFGTRSLVSAFVGAEFVTMHRACAADLHRRGNGA